MRPKKDLTEMDKILKFEKLPQKILIYSEEDLILLPGGQVPITFTTIDKIKFVERVLKSNRLMGVVQSIKTPHETIHFNTGCLARIINFNELEDGYFVIARGICRFDVYKELEDDYNYLRPTEIDYTRYKQDLSHESKDLIVDRVRLMRVLENYMKQFDVNANWDEIVETPDDKLVTALAMSGPFSPLEKQALMESVSLPEQCCIITTLMEMALLETSQSYQ